MIHPTYFAIVSPGRTGSTMLVKLLNSHPRITCLGEEISPFGLYSHHLDMELGDFVRHKLFDNPEQCRGFKMPWPWIREFPGIWDVFHDLNFKLVHSRRENSLALIVSSKLSNINQNWHSTSTYAIRSVTLDPSRVIPEFDYLEDVTKSIRELSTGLDLFDLPYECLAAGKQLNELQRFLGVDPQELTTPTIPMRTWSLSEAIENYAEIREVLTGTRWEYLLHKTVA